MRSLARLAVFLIVGALAASSGRAAEPLRWKFAAGDTLAFHVEQQMQLTMDGPSGPLASTVEQELDTTWQVEKLDIAGNAVIKAKVDRIQTSMRNADEEQFAYDSTDAEAISGLAAMVAPMYDTIAAGEYEIVVSPRGEVRSVSVPEDVADSIEKSPGVSATGTEAAIAAFKALLTQGIVPLPEGAPTTGETWSTSAAVHVPNAESATMETEYRFEGTKEVDGKTYAVIRPTLNLDITSTDKMRTRLKGQQTSGEILFDAAAGRVHSQELEHQAAIDVVVAGQTLTGTLAQKIDVTTSSGD